MHTERNNPTNPTVVTAPIQINLTAAGWTVIAMIAAALFLSASRQLAVGFLIPMAAAIAIDVFLSWQVLSRRTVSITPTRTVVYRPDGIPIRVAASGPPVPLRVSMVHSNVGEHFVTVSDEAESIEFTAAHTASTDFLRSDTSCSVFGLALVHQWQTHLLPALHWAPEPSQVRMTAPEAIDEVAQLREYVAGDRMSRVSWATTARTGRMHVRSAGAGYEEYVVVLNLGAVAGAAGEGAVDSALLAAHDDSQAALFAVLEHSLLLASTLISQLLEDGHQVRLITTEINTYHQSMRQSAIENPRLEPVVASGTTGDPQIVDRFVVDDDDLARRLSLAEVGPATGWAFGTYVEVSMLGVRTLP